MSYFNHFGMENKNVSFLNTRVFWIFYVLVIMACRAALLLLPGFPQQYAMTLTHIIHSIITFQMLHWNKGSPVMEDAVGGQYDKLTFWEQIDGGEQFTLNRKLFTIIPVLLFLWASYDTNWELEILALNFIALSIVLIGKSPYMHRVRILGIND